MERVCVTGGSGCIASWIVKLLLERGYIVHGTVRSLKDQTKIEHLVSMDEAKERRQLFEANLMEEGSFDYAVEGCHGVLPYCLPCHMGFSQSSVLHNGRPEIVVDETWFSTREVCEASYGKWYLLSKTMAEEAAWKFVKEKGIDMVSINPTAYIGTFFYPSLNFSVPIIMRLINESDKCLNMALGWVHVKDVAEARKRASEIPSANGRYILSETVA